MICVSNNLWVFSLFCFSPLPINSLDDNWLYVTGNTNVLQLFNGYANLERAEWYLNTSIDASEGGLCKVAKTKEFYVLST